MYTLFLDTHDKEVIVALYKEMKLVNIVDKVSGYQHSQIALPTIKSLLDEQGISPKDLKEIIVVIGPGSFTGVRIAVTIAKTMAYALNIPLKTIDSLNIKAISYDSDIDFYVSVLEKNGAYVGYFSKDGNKIGEYAYYSKSEYKKFLEENEVKEVEEIDYEKLIVYMNNQEAIPVHAVKPLYIKRIEVLKK